MGGKFLQLNDVNAYKKAFHLSNYIWSIVVDWGYFEKSTVGNQLVRSVDSISANIAEGFGRYTKRDKIKFYRYSFGSAKEVQDWVLKAKTRSLISNEQYEKITKELEEMPREIHHLIKFTNEKLTI